MVCAMRDDIARMMDRVTLTSAFMFKYATNGLDIAQAFEEPVVMGASPRCLLIVFQTAMILEVCEGRIVMTHGDVVTLPATIAQIIHAMVGFVKSSVFSTFLQVFSRVNVVYLAMFLPGSKVRSDATLASTVTHSCRPTLAWL